MSTASDQSYSLPEGITASEVLVRDLKVHYLSAGSPSLPLLLLLHGFPELSFSWRKVILPLAGLGYHIVAPDQRGYGRTTFRSTTDSSATIAYGDDLTPFRMINLVNDAVALVLALGHESVACVVGHDFGSSVAGHCALVRPDVFKAVVLMSAPFTGTPALPFNVVGDPSQDTFAKPSLASMVDVGLAALDPPRKHYTAYFSGPTANEEMWHAPQGLKQFLRGYYHLKSADWSSNDPRPLPAPTPTALAVMEHYYIMPLDETMADVVAREMSSIDTLTKNTWLPDADLAVYVAEFDRTGFQGGLNWYRAHRDPHWTQDLTVFSGLRVEVPAMFLSGRKDWGVYQSPGALEKMRFEICTKMAEEDFVLVDCAGHWVQQERPEEVVSHLKQFLQKVRVD